jgi:hypothetical protein
MKSPIVGYDEIRLLLCPFEDLIERSGSGTLARTAVVEVADFFPRHSGTALAMRFEFAIHSCDLSSARFIFSMCVTTLMRASSSDASMYGISIGTANLNSI